MARARAVKGLRPKATLLENARAIVAVRVAEMFSFAHAVGDPAQDEDMHNMRIAAKRLRYTLEMFHVCLTPDGAALIDVVKEIQERIGQIHDADVLLALARTSMAVAAQRRVEALASAAASGSEDKRVAAVAAALAAKDPLPGLAGLLARIGAKRERSYAAFTAWWQENGNEALRARLDSVVLPDHEPPATVDQHSTGGSQPSGDGRTQQSTVDLSRDTS